MEDRQNKKQRTPTWRTRATGAALALLVGALALYPMRAHADELEDLEAQQMQLMQQAEAQQAKTEEIQAKIDTVSEQLRALSESLSEAQSAYSDVRGRLDRIEDAVLENQKRLEDKNQELAVKSHLLRRRMRDIYMHGQISYLDVLFGAKDFADLTTRMELLSRVLKKDFALVSQVRADKAAIEKIHIQLDRDKKAQAILVRKAADRASEVRARKEDKDLLLERMENDREVSQQAYEELLAASREIENMIRQRRSTYSGQTPGAGGMIWPLLGEVTSEYGWRIHPITGDERYHSGMDIGGDYGEPILAAAAGEVIYADWISGYGYSVIIDHGGGLTTLYAHNESLEVGEGQIVKQGECIATCGSTGNSTGPHCHFEVRMDGEPTDPYAYL